MDYDINPFNKNEIEKNAPEQNPFYPAPPKPSSQAEQHPFQRTVPEQRPLQTESLNFPPISTPFPDSLSALNLVSKPNAAYSYIKSIFSTDLSQYSDIGSRKTGFPNLDAECGMLYPGFYILGAASGMGKTTFVHQIADNLAEHGKHVLYFSLIQSKFELTTKSLSRLTARKNGGRSGITEPEIWLMKTLTKELQAELDSYAAMIGDRISIFDNTEELTIDKISEIVRAYIVGNNVRPVVIVDNLQHLAPKENGRYPNNYPADCNLHSLKILQQKEHLSLIAISNIDTGSYFRHIDFDSFLNPGGIEYTADVIWGLQIQATRETEKAQTKIDARERFFSAKALIPRKMELVCLKNNFGKSIYTCYFDYYPQYNTFVEEKRIEVEKVVVERL
ncbi:MAG: hypothetical protein LBD73_00260 [Deferribacteraceae bacterium]|nr:hypothetical protein [Deferribacteraceae bacterium]